MSEAAQAKGAKSETAAQRAGHAQASRYSGSNQPHLKAAMLDAVWRYEAEAFAERGQ